MIQALEQSAREHWPELAPRAAAPRVMHFLKFAHPDPPAPLLFLVFADRDTRPVAVAKAARVPDGDAAVEREVEHLELAHRLLPETLARVVPRPVSHGRVNGRAYFVCTSLPGELEFHHTWGANRVRRSAARMAAALQWAREVRTVTAAPAIGLCEWLGFPGPDAILERLASWTDAERRRFEPRLREACAAVWPAALAHGDFFPGNLLFRGGAVSGVVDWAHAFRRAPVFADPLWYEITFALHELARGAAFAAAARQAVCTLTPIVEARRELAELGIEASPGSLSRLAVLVAGAVRVEGAWAMRARTAARWGQLLRLELEAT